MSEIAQSCPTLCDTMDCSLPGFSVHGSGLPFLSPGGLPNPGIEPRSPALQADALPSAPPAKLNIGYTHYLKERIHTLNRMQKNKNKNKKHLDLNMWSKTKHLIRIANQNFSKLFGFILSLETECTLKTSKGNKISCKRIIIIRSTTFFISKSRCQKTEIPSKFIGK